MNPWLDQLRDYCRPRPVWGALLAGVALTGIGIAAIGTTHASYASVQTRWLLISLIAAGLCLVPAPRWVAAMVPPAVLVTLGLLVIVILPWMPRWLVPVRNGATCWLDLHFMMFQPSELAKIVFVLALAKYLRYRSNYRTLSGLLVPFGLMFVPVALILQEPDLGTALIFVPALFVMLVAAGARLAHLGALVGLALLMVVLNVVMIYTLPDSMQLLKPHQRQRIVSMIDRARGDTHHVKDIGYQQDKAMTLAGAGGLYGYGATRSATIIRFNKLPEDHNDMIFAVIINRWGAAGGLAVMGLYLVLTGSLLLVAAHTRDPFARLTAVGFGGLLFSQAAINMGMTLGLLPVTGITLPFVSYGGSSLMTTYIMVGLVMNFASRRPAIVSRPAFEFDPATTAAP